MKITESEFREIIRQKLSKKRSLISEQSNPQQGLPAPRDQASIKDFRTWVSTGEEGSSSERVRMLRDIYRAANLSDDKLDYEGDNLSGSNSYFTIAWRLFGRDYNAARRRESTPSAPPPVAAAAATAAAEEPASEEAPAEASNADASEEGAEEEPAAEQSPERMGSGEDSGGGAGMVEFPVHYADNPNSVAFFVKLPELYRDMVKNSNWNEDKTIVKINRKADALPEGERKFTIKFGVYDGQPATSMFSSTYAELDKIKKLNVITDLSIGQIKQSKIFEVYKKIRKTAKLFDKVGNKIDVTGDNQKKIAEIRSVVRQVRQTLEKAKFDKLVVVSTDGRRRRYRFKKNNINKYPVPLRRFLDNASLSGGAAAIAEIDKRIVAASKAPEGENKRKLIAGIIENFETLTEGIGGIEGISVISESFTPEQEIAKIIRELVYSSLKKKE